MSNFDPHLDLSTCFLCSNFDSIPHSVSFNLEIYGLIKRIRLNPTYIGILHLLPQLSIFFHTRSTLPICFRRRKLWLDYFAAKNLHDPASQASRHPTNKSLRHRLAPMCDFLHNSHQWPLFGIELQQVVADLHLWHFQGPIVHYFLDPNKILAN